MKIRGLLLLFLLSGCTSYQVVSDSNNLLWKNGRGYETTENQNVRLTAASDPHVRNSRTFYVEVINKSSQPIVVGPDSFYVQHAGQNWAAVDPEAHIGALANDMSYNQARAQTTTADVVVSALDTVSVLSGSETKEERHEREYRQDQRAQEQSQAAQQASIDQQEIASWQTQALRKNTLAPGQQMAGFLQFELDLQAGPLLLNLAAPDSSLSVPFRVLKN